MSANEGKITLFGIVPFFVRKYSKNEPLVEN